MTSFLRQRRTLMQMSQGDLAERIGVSQQTVARWETSGQIPTKYLKDLAVLMGARSHDFLPRSDESPSKGPLGGPLGEVGFEVDEEDMVPYGDVSLHLRDHAGVQVCRYPITWGALNGIQQQLGDVGTGFPIEAPWIQFETLNNKWVAVRTDAIDRVSFVEDDVEDMSSFEHEEVYRAAREFWHRMPTDEEIDQDGFPYSRQLIESVRGLLGDRPEDAVNEFEAVSVHFTSGALLEYPLNEEVAQTLEAMFTHRVTEELQPNGFLQLTFRDDRAFEHVRLGAIKCIEASLLAFTEECQKGDGD